MWSWNPFKKSWAIVLLVSFIAMGCKQKPENTVSKYLEYTFLDSKGENAYELLSLEDKKYLSKEKFCQDLEKRNILDKKILDKYDEYFFYEIKDTRLNGDTAYVNVKINRPNAYNVLSDLVSYAMVTSFGTIPADERNQVVSQKFDAIMMSKDRLMVSEEKVFKLVNEGGEYKVFLDSGLPNKQHKMAELASSMAKKGEEHESEINYDKAMHYYSEALKLSSDKKMKIKNSEFKKVYNNVALIGKVKSLGKLKFVAEKVEREFENTQSKRGKSHFILTFTVQNISQGQVFKIGSGNACQVENSIVDNFGNTMSPKQMANDSVFNNSDCKLLEPGQIRTVKLYTEGPLTELAERFVWKVTLNTDNKGNREMAYVTFSKKDFKPELATN